MKNINILICGVGGQGILLAGELLGDVALRSGYDVKKSEIHGMAQRGGSVVSHIRFGEKIYSPIIKKGDADFIFSFERMETLRYLNYLKPDGAIIVNNQKISPTNISIKSSSYPEDIESICKTKCKTFKSVDAISIAEQIGNIKTTNTVMIGVLSSFLDFDLKLWDETFHKLIPKKHLDINLKAFNMGRQL
ncbi:MAG TPA: indolepyruvate oxidoreductase subunit beta [Bacteroidota bacterium]|nr:indolepyruvate oxidoreductase subunit beta [Bacteroidota bacterium]